MEARLFWCGPLAFHFGHQIADFGSRVLRSSLDPRGGELLWIPWRTPAQWPALKQWQQQLLTYLNPGHKHLRLATAPLIARELIVWPQQARMRAAPTAFHLEALSWCERTIPKGSQREAKGSDGKRREATGSDGKQREPKGSKGKQREAKGSKGKHREPKGTQGKRREAKGSKGKQSKAKGSKGTQKESKESKGKQKEAKGSKGKQRHYKTHNTSVSLAE